MKNSKFHEKRAFAFSGWLILAVEIVLLILAAANTFSAFSNGQDGKAFFWIFFGILVLWLLGGGLFIVRPNEAKVFMFFGHYVGTVRTHGLQWTIPFFNRISVSLKINNFETNKLKVNDYEGNPVEVAAIIVWRVVDTAKAVFEVQNYDQFVEIQSEAALRSMVMHYAYEDYNNQERSLIKNMDEVAEKLKAEVQERLEVAGIEIIEARISHLAYAQEIAAAMLQRQQAKAVVAARTEIVDGAVGMVEMALQKIEEKNLVKFDEEAKARLVSNLLVVLVSDQNATPVVETGK